ncbi:MAG: hypothetical protein Q8Q54_05230, partial [Methylococcales bacterium]|nr:hypothetical protein [Methylococcales bacterium]
MKIILSRKGFDSENGGMPSPIFPDGKMISLPIPTSSESRSATKISDLRIDGYDIAKVISDLSSNSLTHKQYVHLDPDINYEILTDRPKDWSGAFGQVAAAQGHLVNNSVSKGDLFIYFGWFREVEQHNQIWQFKKNAPNLHMIYGWLFIEDVLSVNDNKENVLEKYPWLANHPHLLGEYNKNNTIYVGSQNLPTEINRNKSGYGVFTKISNIQTLTDTRQSNRSLWKLPVSFYPSEGKTALTYNPAKNWKIENDE